MEPITIIIPTFKRPDLVRQTVEHLLTNFIHDNFEIHVSTDDWADGSKEALAGLPKTIHFNGPRRGMGANLNFLLSTCKTDLIFQIDDDTLLTKPLEMTAHAKKLTIDPKAGVIRFMWLGGHKYHAHLEADNNVNWAYWWVDWDSPEHYIASNRPHLKHKRWHDQMGVFPEGLPIGATEEGFCHLCHKTAATIGEQALGVLIPLDVATETSWTHLGVDSWNQKGI